MSISIEMIYIIFPEPFFSFNAFSSFMQVNVSIVIMNYTLF